MCLQNKQCLLEKKDEHLLVTKEPLFFEIEKVGGRRNGKRKC